jgi:NitT/TauT family transport system ATP-binding protein
VSDIVLQSIGKSFGGKRVLDKLSHTFAAGGVHGLTGPSGSGKTTLLNILLGLTAPDTGAVSGVNTAAVSAVFQEDRLCERASVGANIRIAAPRAREKNALRSLIEEMGLDEKTPVHELSGGMKRRAALLRAIAAPSELIVMDEPFTGLDEAVKQTAAAAIRRSLGGRTLIVVTHSESDLTLLGGSVSLTLPLLG